MQRNVLGKELKPCCMNPMTGFFRDGYCNTREDDLGSHTVCIVITKEFLSYSKSMGNDLSTPMPQFQFPGLKEGDRWCLCAVRWLQAYEDGMAPSVLLESCNEKCLELVDLELLESKAHKELR